MLQKFMSELHPVSIVVLSKYYDVFSPLYKSLSSKKYGSENAVYLVLDGSSPDPIEKWMGSLDPQIFLIKGPSKFSMAGNGNLGLKAVLKDHDILYMGDDTILLEENTVARLQEIAYSNPRIGILSPKLVGRGSYVQVNPDEKVSYQDVKPLEMWFPCVYIKRELIDKIGYLDEQFNDFGCDDFDYCIRTLLSGYKLAVTSKVKVQHGASPEGGPTTFVKSLGIEDWRKQEVAAQQKVREKYRLSVEGFNRLAAGDLSALSTTEISSDPYTGLACNEAGAADYLKSKSIFLAIPVYGGNSLTCNHVNSLLGLQNLCRDLGIVLQVHFVYNESLITRARNSMVREFRNTRCTHMLFVDCDISFDPKDIIKLLFQNEEVIGAPCVRKSLSWDRIISTVRKNGKTYTGEELQKITGVYVVNFNYSNAPSSINVTKLIEVQDVGTGIMLIKREVFDKYEKAQPDNWYLQLTGEDGGRIPTYMFFQAGLDMEAKEHNPGGFPDYISEDYAFCRGCKKAGVRIWLAPYMRTEHMGSYVYKGDLRAVVEAGGSLR